MKMVSYKEINYSIFGRCLQVTNGVIDFVVTLDVGPRIIRFGFVEGDNILFEDLDDRINRGGKDMEPFGDRGIWHIYGGHRLWTSPEIPPRTYFPDNEPVEYVQIKNGVQFIPPVQEWNNIQLEISVTFKNDTTLELNHKVINTGGWPVELAPWALTVLAAGGVEVIPQTKRRTGLLANRIVAVWDYTNMADKRVAWGKDYITVRQDPKAPGKFKIGTNNEDGYAMYFLKGDMFLKTFDTVVNGNYPDGGVNYETFTRNLMLEMETLGELKTLQPSEFTTHKEQWKLVKNVQLPDSEEEIDKLRDKYVI